MVHRNPPLRSGLRFLVAALAVCAAAAGGAQGQTQDDEAPAPPPLPELRPFLDEVRTRLHSDETLLEEYTFTEKHVERELDAKGGVKNVKSETYQVYPSLEPGHTYRRLVERDGRTLTEKELAQEDRKHEKKIGDPTDAEAEAKRAEKRLESRRKETARIEELFRIYEIRIAGRELVDGRKTIRLTFEPRRAVEPSGRAGKVLKTFAGQAWVDEEDRQVVRVDAELIDNLSFGLGILARLHKGSRASLLRRKVNGEIWLPAVARFTGSARLLLFKGLRIDAVSEYSDYRKFQVDTSSDFTPEPPPPQ